MVGCGIELIVKLLESLRDNGDVFKIEVEVQVGISMSLQR